MARSVAFLLALMLSATSALAGRFSDCFHEDPDLSIRGCTQIIERGERESQKQRATAYFIRGFS